MVPRENNDQEAISAVEQIHREVDRRTKRLDQVHRDRLRCGRGCTSCCLDGLTVFTVEALLIRDHYEELLAHEEPGPLGACAFLGSDGSCRIYEQRPYVCRTQGYPLRWLDETPEGAAVEYRDICPLNEEPGPPIELLPEETCWAIGPFEAQLAHVQVAYSGKPDRVGLRSLFHRAAVTTTDTRTDPRN